MNKKGPSKTNLILAIVLVVVCGFAYWLEVKRKPQAKRAADQSTRLLAIEDDQELESLRIVDTEKAIDIEMSCNANCKLSQPNSEWEITKPLRFKADEGNVGTFVTGLAAANIIESIPLEGDTEAQLREYGLDSSKRESRMAMVKLKKHSEPFTVYIGDNAAVGENLYVQATGPGLKPDVVRIVPGYVKTNLQRGLSYWRHKRLLHFAASEVQGFRLENPKGGAEVVREGQNWVLMPGKRLADNEAVDTFLTGLVFMNAQDYLSDNKTKDRVKHGIPVSRPHFNLTLKVANRPDVKLEAYDFTMDGQPRLYAVLSDRDFIVSLERTHVDKFTKTADSFRFRNLLTASEKQEVAEVSVRLAGKDKLRFKSENGKWALVDGKLENFDAETVEQALTKVGAARVATFEGKKPVPRDTPELSSWVLADKSGNRLREFTVYGAPARGDYYVRLSTGELGKLERGSGAAVPSKVADFQPTKPGDVQSKPPEVKAPPGFSHGHDHGHGHGHSH